MISEQQVHPARDTLSAYGLGKLDTAESVALEKHLAECEECCETLLDLGSDTFIDLLRQSESAHNESFPDEATIGLNGPDNETICSLPDELTQHPRYRVLELLGKGGMGDVYKAEHKLMHRTVALKVINHELVQNNQAVERFRREVQSAAKLAHPNIVTAHDAEQAGNAHYLVMEYVPGENLSEVVKRQGPLDVELACDYIRQATTGLDHAHAKGMVHRDIKPHNLMVTTDGQVKILDFGLATLAVEALSNEESDQGSKRDSDRRSLPHLTSAGSMMGTPDFISPEQASDARAVDIRSDIYSLGCTFYYLLTGRPPFTEGSALERVKAHGEREPEPIENVRVEIPSELADVVRRMMAKDPAQRFQTPAEVADALASFVDAHRTTPAEKQVANHDQVTVATSRSWWPPRVLTATALAGFALIFAAVIYVTTDGGTFVVESEDESVEITIRPVNGDSKVGNANHTGWQFRIVDTVTGSTAKWLRSGEYELDLKGDNNNFELNKDRFVLKRGGKVIVKVTRRGDGEHERKNLSLAKVWRKPIRGGAPSPDGRYLAYPDWDTGDLAVRDLINGTSRHVTQKGPWSESGEFAYFHVWSPNGQEIATSWWLPEKHQFDLRIVPLDGGDPRVIYFDKEHYVRPFAWSADGRQILMAREGADHIVQLVLISVADGEARLLKSLDWNWPKFASISPDGRHVVYDMPQEDGSSHRDIFVLNTEGRNEATLIEHPSNDYAPLWAPDGKQVVFTSDRNGSANLWVLAVEDGRPAGFPLPIGIDMSRREPIGISRDGTYYYIDKTSGSNDIYVAKLDSKTGLVAGPATKITRRYEGFNSRPAWSPDGKHLAYVSDRGIGENSSLVIQSVDRGEERVLNASISLGRLLFINTRPNWSPDGKSILLTEGRDEKSRWGIHAIDAATGTVTPLIPATNDSNRRPSSAAWSADGKTVYYIHNTYQHESVVSQVAASKLGTNKERILHESTGSRSPGEYQPPKLYHSLAVSPDGYMLALASKDAISVMPVSGGVPRIVHQVRQGHIPMAVGILWTRDSRSVIFGTAQIRAGSGRLPQKNTWLWQVSIEDGSANEIGLVADYLSHIAMHPDGNKIAYTAAASGVSTDQRGTWTISNFLPPLVEPN